MRRQKVGPSQSPPEAMLCPLCSQNIVFLNLIEREEHADRCLELQESVSGLENEPVKCVPNTGDREIAVATTQLLSEDAKLELSFDKGTDDSAGTHSDSLVPSDSGSSNARVIASVRQERSQSGKREFPGPIAPTSKKSRSTDSKPKDVKSTGSKRSHMPPYKTLKFGATIFAVDAFCYGKLEEVSCYFLTHFHSDHYGGLSRTWNAGPIYCTQPTADLAHSILKVPQEFLFTVPMNSHITVDGVSVRTFDANHCPGAAVFLFNDVVLHTGDFRASTSLCEQVLQHTDFLDKLYLDTTYLDPKRTFPAQAQVIRACVEYCVKIQTQPPPRSFFTKPRPVRILVMVGSYTIGKERLAVSIAEALGSQIWATERKRSILQLLGDKHLDRLLDVPDGLQCQVHLTSMHDLSIAKLEAQWKFLKQHYTRLIAFVPTGWTFTSKTHSNFDASALARTGVTRGFIQICRVPYSEHSSYSELEMFCRAIPSRSIIPTVSCGHRDILDSWEENATSRSA